MDKFVKDAIEQGIASDTMKSMVQREIEHKEAVGNAVRWMRIRQIVTIILLFLISLISLYIAFIVTAIDQNLKDLITVMITTFTEMNKQ